MDKSFAANVLVAKKLIFKGFERYSRQSFGPNISYLRCSRALFSIDDSVLNEWLNEAHTKGNQHACCAHVNACCLPRQYNRCCLRKIDRFEQKAKFHRELTSPHDLTTTTSQRQNLGLGSAETFSEIVSRQENVALLTKR